MSKSALASLTAQYTDSENEEVLGFESKNTPSPLGDESKNSIPDRSPVKRLDVDRSAMKNKRAKKMRRLVSYVDDSIISDEEDSVSESSNDSSSEDEENILQNNESSNKALVDELKQNTMEDNSSKAYQRTIDLEKAPQYAHYKFSLPSEPKGAPAVELVEKVNLLYEKMQNANVDMNIIIQKKKEFRNPSIYEKLIQFCKINEFGTNYPPEIYDPLQWGAESYYEELARAQNNEMIRRKKERKDDKIEQATALARKVEEEAKKRKSKWDQPATARVPVPAPLTTTVTGTKGTVISAFGALPKKIS